VSTQTALDGAAQMGARRGRLFHDSGVPTACPFVGDAQADLAAAWSREYLEAIKPQVLKPSDD
jgi:hypothetical protein